MPRGVPQKFILKGVGKAVVAQFTLPIERVVIPWSIALSEWDIDKDGRSWALSIERHVSEPVMRTDSIVVWLANFNKFTANKTVTAFGQEHGLLELGPRECVGIGNLLPTLPQDLGRETMSIVSNVRAFHDVNRQERSLEVIMCEDKRTLSAPLLHYGWGVHCWFPYAKLRPALTPNSEPATILRFGDRHPLRRLRPT